MKSVRFYQYGGPEILRTENIQKPVPGPSEILIKVKAVSINPLDWHVMRGTPYFMRLMTGLLKPTKFNSLGADIAGTIEEIGESVSGMEIGDEVFGDIFNYGLSGMSEFVSIDPAGVVKKPENLSFEQAAAVPVAGLTALHGLQKFGPLTHGQKVLINGASGGVGTFAVQLAKLTGAHVTGVCSDRNVEMVGSIGADEVIDYTQNPLRNSKMTYDFIFDAVGNLSLKDYRRLLKPDGNCAVVGYGGFGHLLKTGLFGGANIKLVDFKADQQHLKILANHLAENRIRPVIDRTYKLEDASKAIAYLETGRARGKVILTI